MRKNVKEPLMDRLLILNMTFESIAEREAAYDFLNSEGRTPASFLAYAVREAMKKSGHLKQVVGLPADGSILGVR